MVLCRVQKSIGIFLQLLGKPLLPHGLSLLRNFVRSSPLVLMPPRAFGVVGALYSAPIADVVSLLAAASMTASAFRQLNRDTEADKTALAQQAA